MLRHFATTLKATTVAAAMAIMVGGARAAAVVGASYQVPIVDMPKPTLGLKAEYQRPDTIPFPAGNQYSPAKALLGRMLYNDTRLSESGALACVSCHNPGFAYGDGLKKAVGNGMREMDRRSPSLVNSAWGETFMWDGRSLSLEAQALCPIQSPTEMGQQLDQLTRRLAAIDGYQSLFAKAFPNQPITPIHVADAIATHERTIVSADAPFDAWIEGNEAAVSDAAKRGFALFNAKALCAGCHGGWNFTDNGFHDIGLPDSDEGRGRLMPQVVKMQHAFKTPSLRDTARRGPYMHDGSMPTLDAVVARYSDGGVDRPSRSELIMPLNLSPEEQADIVAFLITLTSTSEADYVPALPQ